MTGRGLRWRLVEAKRRPPPRRLEDQMQRQVISYWQRQYPETWRLTVHCPSGMAASSHRLAAIFRGLGWKPGVPDLLCFCRRGDYSGLALELKSGKNKPTAAQAEWLAGLEREGWRCAWGNDLAVFGDILDQYHALGPPP